MRTLFLFTRPLLLACAAVAAGVSAAPAQPEAANERLISPPLRGYFVYYAGSDRYRWERTEFPNGQSRANWRRRMVTQRYFGSAPYMDVAHYAQVLAARSLEACPGSLVSPIVRTTISGRLAGRFQIDCPRNEAGTPEISLVLIVAGKADMHVKQFAFRGAVPTIDLDWARGVLEATVFCDADDKQPVCQ